jgi:hypothetical protein
MVTLRTQATPHPEVVATALQNGETILLHLGTHAYYTLNESGSRIWQYIEQGYSVAEMGQALKLHYEVGPNQAQQCVVDLVAELAAQQLISLAGPAPTAL